MSARESLVGCTLSGLPPFDTFATCAILAAWLEDPIRGWRNRVCDG
jgi:hypothetical protein